MGYSVDNERKQSIVYDPATGRISESDGFKWTYLPGTNLKSSLTYPNEDVVTWIYEPHRDLLTAVTNATYSTYVYTNDLLGRPTSKNDEQYGYNVRDELISVNDTSYAYDDIGNRTTAEGKTYTASNLNQYTAIDDFVPGYDADGNQTLIKTGTGIWSVVYNAENRPIRWQSGDTVITMAFDRLGRRVEMRTIKDGKETLQRFVYDNYLCVQQLRGPENTLFHSYVWDPTEPIATRPLIFRPASSVLSYYFHDGNKNVSDLVDIQEDVVHYDYTPFGSQPFFVLSDNPFYFSSEVYDSALDLMQYNYRTYNTHNGRWCSFEKGDDSLYNLYLFLDNSPMDMIDFLGLSKTKRYKNRLGRTHPSNRGAAKGFDIVSEVINIYATYIRTPGRVVSSGIEACSCDQPHNSCLAPSSLDGKPIIYKAPKEYCCVILYELSGGLTQPALYYFLSASVTRKPCSQLTFMTSPYVYVITIPWFVYE